MKMISLLLAVSTMVAPLAAKATGDRKQTIKEKMMDNLDIIKDSFAVTYAPATWKKTYCDWDLEEQIELSKIKIQETEDITLKDFYRIVRNFFSSTHDYHVRVSFYSTEAAFLPFRVHGTKGKYYIAWKIPEFFTGFDTPLSVGDEILLFDNRPVDDVIKKIVAEESGGFCSLTDQALAEYQLTFRNGCSAHVVPEGPVSITVRHAGTTKVTTYHLSWIYLPEEVAPLDSLSASSKNRMNHPKPLGKHPFFHREMCTPVYENYKMWSLKRDHAINKVLKKSQLIPFSQEIEEDCFLGARDSCFPILGRMKWQSADENPFQAYVFENPEGRSIGFIRLPDYLGESAEVKKFAEIITIMEIGTDALIVDQTNNPGGFLHYLYALASMLSDKPLIFPKHRMALTQEDIFYAIELQYLLETVDDDASARDCLGKTITGYPVTYELAQCMLTFCQVIVNEWESGRRLTHPIFPYGLDQTVPHPRVHYTKPILFLVNQLAFSGGDFMPAILQDNRRAVVMGTKTAGAGGFTFSHAYPNLLGIKEYSLTASIAQRMNKDPIEDLGVTPDHIVEMTRKDLEGGKYVNFVCEIHRQIDLLLSSTTQYQGL